MNNFITAEAAREITAEAIKHRSDPWNLVFDKIKEAAEKGNTVVIINESKGIWFNEPRKKVAEKLRELGYEVEYRRASEHDPYYPGYYNIYTISWGGVNNV